MSETGVKPRFVFSIDRDGIEIRVCIDADIDFVKLLDAFEQFAIAVGYAPENVREVLGE